MKEIKALTSLRGIAALAVVMQHFSATAQSHAAVSIPSLVPHGYMAVSLFFVLSGFIMAYTYQADFAHRGMQAMAPFLLKRAARILPLNIVAVLLIVFAGGISTVVAGHNIFPQAANGAYDVVCNLLLLQGFGIGTNLNGPSWSISTECAAYLMFPPLLALTFSRRKEIVLGTAGLAIAAMAIMAMSQPRLGLGANSVAVELTLCFAQFVLGLLTFRAWQMPSVAARLRGDGSALLAAGWIAVMLVLRIDLLAAAGFPFVIAALACNTGRVSVLLSRRLPYFLGEISFSIYLLHDPCRPLALELLRSLHPAPLAMLPALGFALAGSLAIIPLAWLAYVAIERPGRRAVRGFAGLFMQPAGRLP